MPFLKLLQKLGSYPTWGRQDPSGSPFRARVTLNALAAWLGDGAVIGGQDPSRVLTLVGGDWMGAVFAETVFSRRSPFRGCHYFSSLTSPGAWSGQEGSMEPVIMGRLWALWSSPSHATSPVM